MKKARGFFMIVMIFFMFLGSAFSLAKDPGAYLLAMGNDTGVYGDDLKNALPTEPLQYVDDGQNWNVTLPPTPPVLFLKHNHRVDPNPDSLGRYNMTETDYSGQGHLSARYGLHNPQANDFSYRPSLHTTGFSPASEAAISVDSRLQQHVIVNHAEDLSMTCNYTIAMVVKPIQLTHRAPDWMGLMSKAAGADDYSIMFALDPNLKLAHYVNNTGEWKYSTESINSQDWSYVAMTLVCDRTTGLGTLKFYVNGRPVGEHGGLQSGISNSGDLRVGSWPGPLQADPGVAIFRSTNTTRYGPSYNPEYNFHGLIDQTYLWDRVLPESELYANCGILGFGACRN